jgi:hypothetical protein
VWQDRCPQCGVAEERVGSRTRAAWDAEWAANEQALADLKRDPTGTLRRAEAALARYAAARPEPEPEPEPEPPRRPPRRKGRDPMTPEEAAHRLRRAVEATRAVPGMDLTLDNLATYYPDKGEGEGVDRSTIRRWADKAAKADPPYFIPER